MNFEIPVELYAQLRQAKQLAVNRLLRPNFFANVVGVGIGQKVVDGAPTETWAIRIYVQSKLTLADLTPAFQLPSSFLDFPTDIIEVGLFGRPGLRGNPPASGPGSAILIDSSAPNINSGAIGTFGSVLADDNRKYYILSCNHVLTANGRVKSDAAARLVNSDANTIGKPGPFVPLLRDGHNQVDCALGVLANGGLAYGDNPGAQVPPLDPHLGMYVTKTGAASGTTAGAIVDVDADLYIDYSFGTFRFSNQIVIDGQVEANPTGDFADDGDSGSIVFAEAEPGARQPVGMVFAETGRYAVACRLTDVLEQLGQKVGSRLSFFAK